MSDDQLTNGKRAALALDAINVYARSSPWEGSDEDHFFFDFERAAEPGTDQDRLSALLCGLMHYAERRQLSFGAALRSARQDYQRQRTAYLPGDAVRRTDRAPADPSPGGRPLTGEIVKARPGNPPSYLVDFITSREWLTEPYLTPAPHFMTIPTGSGHLRSAHVARLCLNRIVPEIEGDYLYGTHPDEKSIRDLRAILVALSNWSGIARPELLRSVSEIITEQDGWLMAGARSTDPVRLAAAEVAVPLGGILPASGPLSAGAAALVPPRPTRRSRKGGR